MQPKLCHLSSGLKCHVNVQNMQLLESPAHPANYTILLDILTQVCTFEHAEKRPLTVEMIVEEHVTAVETTTAQLGSEKEGEAPGLRVIGWACKLEPLAFSVYRCDVPPPVIVVQQRYISRFPGATRLPVQENIIPLDPRTDYGEGRLSPSGSGNYSTCRREGNMGVYK